MSQTQVVRGVATSIESDGNVTRILYHGTPVVSFDGLNVTLQSNGWRTATTKTRMNQAANQFGLGFGVYQKNGEWFVSFDDGRADVIYYDGIEFSRRK